MKLEDLTIELFFFFFSFTIANKFIVRIVKFRTSKYAPYPIIHDRAPSMIIILEAQSKIESRRKELGLLSLPKVLYFFPRYLRHMNACKNT